MPAPGPAAPAGPAPAAKKAPAAVNAPRRTTDARALAFALLIAVPAAFGQLSPNNYIASGDQCRDAGGRSAWGAASQACEIAMRMCSGAVGSAPLTSSIGAVSLPQCANIAYGSCQQEAAPSRAPCARHMSTGYGVCDGGRFASYYTSAMSRNCYSAAASVTGVAPGTDQWVPTRPGQPQVAAVVSPGSIVGGGIGSAIGGAIAGDFGRAIGGAIGTSMGNGVDRQVINTITGRRLLAAAPTPRTVGDLLA